MTAEDRIDPSDLRDALGVSMRDPGLQRVFKGAPEGAKRVLKIRFCSAVFPERVDRRKMIANVKALDGELEREDLEYLLTCEVDEELIAHFNGLLSSGKAERKEGGRSSLRVIKSELVGTVDLNAEAIKRQLSETEREKTKEARSKAAAVRRGKVKAVTMNVTCVVAVVVVLAGAWFWYSSLAARRAREEKARIEAKQAQEAEMRRQEAERRKEAERQERERAARKEREEARRIKEEAERKARREAEAKRKEEQENRQKVERQEEAENREQERIAREKFESVGNLFRKAKPLPWRTLDKAHRPGAVEGTFHCAIPGANGGVDLFAVESSANGSMKVVSVSEKDAVETPFAGWNDRLQEYGGVIHNGSKVYLFQPKAKDACQLPQNDFDPSKMRLGELVGLVRDFGMDMNAYTFECRVTCKGVKNAISVSKTAFGHYVSCYDVKAKVREAVAASVKKPKSNKRRTVMFYDGGIVKKQLNGVILVPRNPIRFDSKYADWRAEAERQEFEENRALDDRYAAEVEKKVNAALESARLTVTVSE